MKAPKIPAAISAAIAALLLSMVGALLLASFGIVAPAPPWQLTLQAMFDGTGASFWRGVALIAGAAIIFPCIEEFVFRHLLQRWLSRRMRLDMAIAMTAILFAAAHCDVTSLVPLSLVSACFSWAFVKGGWATSALAHSLYNTVVLAIALLQC